MGQGTGKAATRRQSSYDVTGLDTWYLLYLSSRESPLLETYDLSLIIGTRGLLKVFSCYLPC